MTPWHTFLIAMVVCGGGFAYAVFVSGMAADAGRGGAVAVALSFWILFQDHGSAKRAFDDQDLDPETSTRNALGALIDVDETRKWPLTLTSVSGTLVWGFADIPARWFGAQ